MIKHPTFVQRKIKLRSDMSVSQPNEIPNHFLPGYDPGVFSTEKHFLMMKRQLSIIGDSSQKVEVIAHTSLLEEIARIMSLALTRNPNWFMGIIFLSKAVKEQAYYKKIAGPVSNKEVISELMSKVVELEKTRRRIVAEFDLTQFEYQFPDKGPDFELVQKAANSLVTDLLTKDTELAFRRWKWLKLDFDSAYVWNDEVKPLCPFR